jgi:hypothetical protein
MRDVRAKADALREDADDKLLADARTVLQAIGPEEWEGMVADAQVMLSR